MLTVYIVIYYTILYKIQASIEITLSENGTKMGAKMHVCTSFRLPNLMKSHHQAKFQKDAAQAHMWLNLVPWNSVSNILKVFWSDLTAHLSEKIGLCLMK